jgi:hypothetical protein
VGCNEGGSRLLDACLSARIAADPDVRRGAIRCPIPLGQRILYVGRMGTARSSGVTKWKRLHNDCGQSDGDEFRRWSRSVPTSINRSQENDMTAIYL